MAKKKEKSKREKGNEFQRWVLKILEGMGWTVRNFPTRIRPRRIRDKKTGEIKEIYVPEQNDVWGADLLARKGMRMLYIQASLDSNIKKRVEEYMKYFKAIASNEDLQIWIKTPGGIVNVKRVIIDGQNSEVEDIGKFIRKKFYKATS